MSGKRYTDEFKAEAVKQVPAPMRLLSGEAVILNSGSRGVALSVCDGRVAT